MTHAAHPPHPRHVPPPPERLLQAEIRQLHALVDELSLTLVVQGAYLSALEHRRARPNEHDIDEALATVADNVPEDVAERLWSARDALITRLRSEPASV